MDVCEQKLLKFLFKIMCLQRCHNNALFFFTKKKNGFWMIFIDFIPSFFFFTNKNVWSVYLMQSIWIFVGCVACAMDGITKSFQFVKWISIVLIQFDWEFLAEKLSIPNEQWNVYNKNVIWKTYQIV